MLDPITISTMTSIFLTLPVILFAISGLILFALFVLLIFFPQQRNKKRKNELEKQIETNEEYVQKMVKMMNSNLKSGMDLAETEGAQLFRKNLAFQGIGKEPTNDFVALEANYKEKI